MKKRSEILEMKTSAEECEEAIVSICAMLNRYGVGKVYFGINPDGTVVGQEISDSVTEKVHRLIRQSIRPRINPLLSSIVLDEKNVLEVRFYGDQYPYSAEGKYYVRAGLEDREIPPDELDEFVAARQKREEWDRASSDCLTREADKPLIEDFWSRARHYGMIQWKDYTMSKFLKEFGLSKGSYLTNAGNILFGGVRPISVKLTQYASEDKSVTEYKNMYWDNIMGLLYYVQRDVFAILGWKKEFVDGEWISHSEIPYWAFQEAFVNSLAHASYGTDRCHEICIYPSRVTLYNPGSYASAFQPKEYMLWNLPSSLRHPLISKMLYLNLSMSISGFGLSNIYSDCRENKARYSFKLLPHGFLVTFFRKPL